MGMGEQPRVRGRRSWVGSAGRGAGPEPSPDRGPVRGFHPGADDDLGPRQGSGAGPGADLCQGPDPDSRAGPRPSPAPHRCPGSGAGAAPGAAAAAEPRGTWSGGASGERGVASKTRARPGRSRWPRHPSENGHSVFLSRLMAVRAVCPCPGSCPCSRRSGLLPLGPSLSRSVPVFPRRSRFLPPVPVCPARSRLPL